MENNLVQNQWAEEIALIKQRISTLDHTEKRIAFYGSSSIRLWDTIEADLFPLSILNMGFGGSTYQDCVHYFSYLFSDLLPARLVLYGGDNDIANGNEPITILHQVQVLVGQIRAKFPKLAISIMSVKPSPSRASFMSQIQETNQLLKLFSTDIGADYIDIFSAMLQADQQANVNLFVEDGLHLNQSGYELWSKILKPHLQAIP